jgi:Uma2 family endonuclease
MSTAAKAPPITVEQYLGFEGFPGLRDELINGEIVLSPQPKPLHADIARNVERLLERAIEGKDFVVRQNVNMDLREDNSMPSPDVFVIERSRWVAARDSNGYPERSPILAVEVISPANRRRRIEQKVELYLKNGAAEVWVVYPKKQCIRVHALGTQVREYVLAEMDCTLALPAPLSGAVQLSGVFRLET